MKIEENKAKNFILNVWKDPNCGVCGSRDYWEIQEDLFTLMEYQGYNFDLNKSKVQHALMVIACTKCGNTHMFSAKITGMI